MSALVLRPLLHLQQDLANHTLGAPEPEKFRLVAITN
jgi:hypothetical protein